MIPVAWRTLILAGGPWCWWLVGRGHWALVGIAAGLVLAGALMVINDLTERRNLEERLHHACTQLGRVNERNGKLQSRVSAKPPPRPRAPRRAVPTVLLPEVGSGDWRGPRHLRAVDRTRPLAAISVWPGGNGSALPISYGETRQLRALPPGEGD